jgi:N utilization substance protein A
MLEIEGFDEDIVKELRNSAKEALLMDEIASEEREELAPSAALRALPGMNQKLANLLAKQGIATVDDLAEQSVDDLIEIKGVDEERAANLIMAARASWFEESNQS